MRESIFFASIRSFFIVLFGVTGLFFGAFLVAAIFGIFSLSTDGIPDLNYTYTTEIEPNASGVRKIEVGNVPVILKLNITGVIGLDSLKRKDISELLIESRERSLADDRVKAILLYIDSPGGTVTDSDGIYHALMAYKEKYKVPVYAFVDGLCASGGYYIAAAADKIFAGDTCLVGSVGVIGAQAMNFSQLMEKIGIQSITLYDGKGKDSLNPFRPWRKGDEENIQAAINYYYQMFVNIVTDHRPSLSKSKLIDDYGASVYPAPIAKEHGYIDESGYTVEKTLQEILKVLNIEDDKYQVVSLENKNWINELFHSKFGLLHGKVSHQVELLPGVPSELSNQFLYLYRP